MARGARAEAGAEALVSDFFTMTKMNLSIIRSGRPHAGIVFGAVEKSPGLIGILPGACARPKRSRVERSAALLQGCDPGNLALRRRGAGDGGASRPATGPQRGPRATAGDLRSKSGMEAERDGA